MSLVLPQNPKIRALFNTAELDEFARLPTLQQAKRAAALMFEDSAVRKVFSLVLRANGQIHLLSFGPRGGRDLVWNFGNPLKPNGGRK